MQNADARKPWSQPPADPVLQPGQVDVWRLCLDLSPAAIKRMGSVLSADESRRAARFRFPADRDRYILAHAGLREILSRYLECPPDQISFSVNEYGKPSLPDHRLEFNLSHSGDFALVAVADGRKIGVDVERFRPGLEIERLAGRFFSNREVAALAAIPSEHRPAAFFRCWTRKEAYIKAQGLGLSLPLRDFDVSLGDPAVLHATRPEAQEAARWTLTSLEVNPGYAGAVAAENAALSLPAPAISWGPRKQTTGGPGSKGAALSSRPEQSEGSSKGEPIAFKLWEWKTQTIAHRP